MSVEQEKIVDFIGDNEAANEVVLFITDHLPWDDSANEHLNLLQKKINKYIAFIESGELVQLRPSAVSKKKVIEVQTKYENSDIANSFYKHAKERMDGSGIELRFSYQGN
ncbi:hypothetical protein IPH19_04135 [Candidatus Uhrbacteria bacterium]|nr:MAG: hypothetical protein IPH19_04135 [Candidatus Uhrbacteria bacterium]